MATWGRAVCGQTTCRLRRKDQGAGQTLRIERGLAALDYAGREGRLLAYAYDSAKRSPWSPAEPTFAGGPPGNLSKAPNGQLVLGADFSVGQPVETRRPISMEVRWSAIGGDPRHLVFRLLLWERSGGSVAMEGSRMAAGAACRHGRGAHADTANRDAGSAHCNIGATYHDTHTNNGSRFDRACPTKTAWSWSTCRQGSS